MASNQLPVFSAPTPPPEDDDNRTSSMSSTRGLGLRGIPETVSSSYAVMPESLLSAEPTPQTPHFGSMSSAMPSALPTPSLTLSPASSGDNEFAAIDTDDNTLSTEASSGPFRFKSRTYTANTGASLNRTGSQKSVVSHTMGQRRGHRYKHSSVSHQIFLEPPPRAPLRLPASLPIPTTREGWHSMSTEQTMRVCWCFCHLFVAAYVQWTAQGSLALTALSHLTFYDAIGAFLCASVEVLSNFEVWKRSSIRQPFGLERSEVLVGFAMSILLLFMGFDLISHNMAHILDSSEGSGHEPHRPHNHDHAASSSPLHLASSTTDLHIRVSSGSIDLTSLLAIASTLISALMLQNHARMARSMRLARIDFLPLWLNNPSHLLTLSCSTLLLLMPLLSFDMYTWLDRALSTSMALAMCVLGYQLVKTLGAMLLMSYSPPTADDAAALSNSKGVPTSGSSGTVNEVVRDISSDPSVSDIVEAKFWQVHYGLCLANLKLRYQGTEDGLARLKERVVSLVKNRLGGGYGAGSGATWEVSVELVWDGRPGDMIMRE